MLTSCSGEMQIDGTQPELPYICCMPLADIVSHWPIAYDQ